MSARFAIPATTFVLRALIEERLKIAYGALAPPPVSVEPPPRPSPTNGNPGNGAPPPEPAQLHLVCHHVAPNPAWRNMYDPRVSSSGLRAGPSPVALDLQYILAATGTDLEREVLLGLGIVALSRFGIIPRPKIVSILAGVVVPANPTKILDLLTTEQLGDPAEQPEQITVSQQLVDLDLSTKLWSAFQSPLRPSAYFLVTTVFLEVDEVFAPPMAVDRVTIGARPDVTGAPADPEDLITTVATS
ncbi:Pvc16 family protein [Agromyces sp. NPDC056379]|uniref:Pvc16 family protein n=1 Tax=unclassified Agromyces TaxID=2639701 RepID=UPI0035D7F27A